MKKYIIIILFSLILSATPVFAFTLDKTNSSYLVKYTNPITKVENQTTYMFYKDLSKNEVLYQINIGDFHNPEFSFTKLTEKQNQYLKKIMYYGYGYENHNNKYWIYATQLKIWQYLYPNLNVRYLTISQNVDDCLQNLNTLLKEGKTNYAYTFDINNIEDIIFQNEVEIIKSNVNYDLKNNKLKVNAIKPGTYQISIKENFNKSEPLKWNYHASQQDFYIRRQEDYSNFYDINVEITGYNITINSNVDSIWGIYDKNHNLLKKVNIDKQISFYKTNEMSYISQIETPENMKDNDTIYYIDENHDYDIQLNYSKIEPAVQEIKNPETKSDFNKILLIPMLFISSLILMPNLTILLKKMFKK